MPKRANTSQVTRSFKRLKMSNVIGGDTNMDDREKMSGGTDPIQQAWSLTPGPPTYTHVVLPYIQEQHVVTSPLNTSEITLRMTSIYDPSVAHSNVDMQPGAAVTNGLLSVNPVTDTAVANTGYCAYFKYYESLYKYYSVIGCRYSISIENLSHDRMWAHLLFHQATYPPRNASNWDMQLWKGIKSQVLHPKARFLETNGIPFNEQSAYNYDNEAGVDGTFSNNGTLQKGYIQNTGSSIVHFEGEYRPGQYDQEVILDGENDTWTPTNENPKLPELLTVRLKTYDNAAIGPEAGTTRVAAERPLLYNYVIKLTYLVEFKELKDEIRWPVNRNGLTVVYNSDQQAT